MPKMRLSKRWIMRMIVEHGVSSVLTGFDGTDEEALELVRNDPREYFTDKDVIGQPPEEEKSV